MAVSAQQLVSVEYVEDPNGTLTADAVRALPASAWKATQNANFGFTTSVYWFRTVLYADQLKAQQGILEVGVWHLNQIDIWLDLDQRKFATQHIQLGDNRPFEQRLIHHRRFLLPIDWQAQQPAMYLFARVQTASPFQFPLTFWKDDSFHTYNGHAMLFQGSYIGVMLTILLYNLFLLKSTHKRVYLLYILWITSIAMQAVSEAGLSFQYLWPNYPEWNLISVPILLNMVALFVDLFGAEFLKLSKGPRWRKQLIIALVLIDILAFISCVILPTRTSTVLAVGNVMLSLLVLVLLSLHCVVTGFKPARIFLLGFAPVLIGGSVLACMTFGLIERNLWTENAAQIGSAMEALVASFGLAVRLHHEQRLRQAAQASAFNLEFNNRQLTQANQLAEQSSAMKSEFLALMSHELRTPLSAIIGMLKLGLRMPHITDSREHFQEALKNAEYLINLVNDLLDLAKIEAGKLKLEQISFDLRVEAQEAINLLIQRAHEKGIELELSLDPELPNYVVGDPVRFKQILINLIGNAIKFTATGGVYVFLRADQLEEQHCHVSLEVHDTGIGMDDQTISRLFQKFEQADTSTTRKYGGTGLGLAISRQIVEAMHSQIGAFSLPGQGSTFFAVFPFPIGTEVEQLKPVVLQPHTHQLRILCAEDSLPNQLIIRAMLEDLGHQVDIVEDGLAAIQALTETYYDVILMDGRMPVMDGIMATQHIRRGHLNETIIPHADILIFALSANVSEKDRTNFLNAGMDGVLAKPVKEETLHQVLEKVIALCLAQGQKLMSRQVTAMPADLDALFAVEGPDADDSDTQKRTQTAQSAAPNTTSQPAGESTVNARQAHLTAKMLLAFIEQTTQRIADIEKALATQDFSTIAILVHGIKGSASYLWPDSEVVTLGARLEAFADHAENQQFLAEFDLFKEAIQRAQANGIESAQ